MDWLMLSVLSAAFFGFSSMLDKQIVCKYLRDPKACIFFAVCFDVFYGALVGVSAGFKFSASIHTLAAIIAGFLGVSGGFIWYSSIRNENVSMVNAIASSAPLYTFLLAVLFLGESITITQAFGVMAMVLGSMVVSMRKEDDTGNRRALSKMLPPMILATLLWGASSIFVKYSLGGLNFWDSVVAKQIGNLIAVLPAGFLLLGEKRKGSGIFKKELKGKTLLFLGLSEGGYMIGVVLFTLASSLGPISLVSAAGAVQPLFVLLWIFLLGRRHVSSHETGLESMKPVILGTILIMAGIFLIS